MNQLKYIEAFPGVYTPVETYRSYTGVFTEVNVEGHSADFWSDGWLELKAYKFHWNGANYLPDDPTTMRASAEHDFLTGLMQHGILPISYFNQVTQRFLDVCKEDGATSVLQRIAERGLSSTFAREYADPANYKEPKVMYSPDPNHYMPGTEEHTDHEN